MRPVVRLGDMCSGHQCWPPRPSTSGAVATFNDHKPIHRVSDSWAIHCCSGCHIGIMASGSPTFFVENKPVARIGDPINCGSFAATGSTDLFTN